MRAALFAAVIAVPVLACITKGKSQADCDKIANDIRTAATAKGISPTGVCTNPDPQVQKDFGSACNALKECNDDCCND